MSRAVVLFLLPVACTSKEERARQATEFRHSRDALLTTDVIRSLQPPAAVGRLIYDRPADLSYDSLRVKRPELLSTRDRSGR